MAEILLRSWISNWSSVSSSEAPGKNIKREDARKHIYGYCIFNDMSARDAQYREYPTRIGASQRQGFRYRKRDGALVGDGG